MMLRRVLFLFLFVSSMAIAQVKNQSFSYTELKHFKNDTSVVVKHIKSFDDVGLNLYQFTPTTPSVAKLIFLHGGGAHSQLGYFHLAKTLRDNFSIETVLMDIRGHGYSGGKRGDNPQVNSVYKDISICINAVKKDENVPIYLGGHSSGGGLVLNYSSWHKKENVDGYIFVSPELGYKSDTERPNCIDFADVKVWKFVLNGMFQGVFMQHVHAVFFNHPKSILKENPLLLTSITVNMSKALTPNHPKKQFETIGKPIALFVGEQDELFDPKRVITYPHLQNVKQEKTIAKVIKNQTHLSILNTIGHTIGETISYWQKPIQQ